MIFWRLPTYTRETVKTGTKTKRKAMSLKPSQPIKTNTTSAPLRLGLDIGSTTVKCVVIGQKGDILYERYERHYSHVNEKAAALLQEMEKEFAEETFFAAISGSAGMGVAETCHIPFAQEVFATRVAARSLAPDADVVIELGGEDAKILFLSGGMEVRMNGSCAGGTGAFIDQMATLLKISPEELNTKAKGKEKVYTIASRCGVFAKTDIQPLLNQGARVEDVAASILYSVVNQTVAGLAQGRAIKGKVLYLGGPLTFLSELRDAFDKVLKLQGILPQSSLYFVSIGAALCADEAFTLPQLREKFLAAEGGEAHFNHAQPLFSSKEEYEAFALRHQKASVPMGSLPGYKGRAHLGIDAGSTTLKTVLLSEEGELLDISYQPNSGNPVPLLRETVLRLYEQAPKMQIASATTTGYGEVLCREALCCDYSLVETMAHFRAAKHFEPEVDFIIDIGGQDMKCFRIEDGAVSDIFLNEACSSGCGSFLQTFAEALGQDVKEFAKLGLYGDAPVELGSRCTVFMNSSVKQAQKDGASIENISAGLAQSVVKNALYKVIRASNPQQLGKKIVVQGGTFYNDAVLRSFEKEMGVEVIRPSIAGLMGAFGAALYGRKKSRGKEESSLLNKQDLLHFSHTVTTATCGLCTNHCHLTVNLFSEQHKYISGNRCDRPVTKRQAHNPLDIYEHKMQLLESYAPVAGERGTIAFPMGLNFYETLPFWHTFFTKLGFEVHKSPRSSRKLYFSGQGTIPSDTVCYPAKLMHGHVRALLDREDIETIFYPCMSYNIDEGISDNCFNCPVVAYYPEVIQSSFPQLSEKRFIYDYVGIHRPKDFPKKMTQILQKYWKEIGLSEVKLAAKAAYAEYDAFLSRVREKGREIIEEARKQGLPIIVLAGRPYHLDNEINHGIEKLVTAQGAAVVSEDAVSDYEKTRITGVLNQWTYHARLYAAARYVASQKDMNLVQLVSFGCGLDAVTTDEVREILHSNGKLYTQIKIDEIANLGAVSIRLRSLFAALEPEDPSVETA